MALTLGMQPTLHTIFILADYTEQRIIETR